MFPPLHTHHSKAQTKREREGRGGCTRIIIIIITQRHEKTDLEADEVVVVVRGEHGLPREELPEDGPHRPQVHRLMGLMGREGVSGVGGVGRGREGGWVLCIKHTHVHTQAPWSCCAG